MLFLSIRYLQCQCAPCFTHMRWYVQHACRLQSSHLMSGSRLVLILMCTIQVSLILYCSKWTAVLRHAPNPVLPKLRNNLAPAQTKGTASVSSATDEGLWHTMDTMAGRCGVANSSRQALIT
jgi:hypothetical protein